MWHKGYDIFSHEQNDVSSCCVIHEEGGGVDKVGDLSCALRESRAGRYDDCVKHVATTTMVGGLTARRCKIAHPHQPSLQQ